MFKTYKNIIMTDIKKTDEKSEKYEGVVTRPFKVSNGYLDKEKKKRKPFKEFNLGDKFSTSNLDVYKDLINKKRIK
jgi:hypothetical protein